MRLIDPMIPADVQYIRQVLQASPKVVALTGAGVNTRGGTAGFCPNSTVAEALETLHDQLSTRTGEDGQVLFNKDTGVLLSGISEETLNDKVDALWHADALRSMSAATALGRLAVMIKEYTTQCVSKVSPMYSLLGDLRATGRLLHWYTQNVDGLEARTGCVVFTGLDERFNVARARGDPAAFDVLQLDGGLNTIQCTTCRQAIPWDLPVQDALWHHHELPLCPKHIRTGRSETKACQGHTRLSLVLRGEENPYKEYVRRTLDWDISQGANVLLIAGSSLEEKGAMELVQTIANRIHEKKGHVIVVDSREPSPEDCGFVDFYVWAECDTLATTLNTENQCDMVRQGGRQPTTAADLDLGRKSTDRDDLVAVMLMLEDY